MSVPLRRSSPARRRHSDPSIRVAHSFHSHLRLSPQCLPVARAAKAAQYLLVCALFTRSAHLIPNRNFIFQSIHWCLWKYYSITWEKDSKKGSLCLLLLVASVSPGRNSESFNSWSISFFGEQCVILFLETTISRSDTHARARVFLLAAGINYFLSHYEGFD